MPRTKKKSIWPSDDEVRDRGGDRVFADDGRKVVDSEGVGSATPDADPEERPPPPAGRR
jgi:hypothetical protein